MTDNEKEKTGFEAIGERIARLHDDSGELTEATRETEVPQGANIEPENENPRNDLYQDATIGGGNEPQSHFARNFFLAAIGFILFIIFVAPRENGNKSSPPPVTSDARTEDIYPSEKPFKERCAALMEKKDWNALIDIAFKWEQAEPKNPAPLLYKCLAYNKLGKYDYALYDCKSAMNLDSQSSDALALLVVTYVGLGNKEAALEAHSRLRKLNRPLADKLHSLLPKNAKTKKSSVSAASRSDTPYSDSSHEPPARVREWVDEQGNKHWSSRTE